MAAELNPAESSRCIKVGRPRSEESREAILCATWELLKTTSVRDLSIEAIAKAAGVGKTTIYRWWENKAAVVVDAFLEKVTAEIPFPNTALAAPAFEKQFATLTKAFSGDYGRIVAEILAEGQTCPSALALFRDRFLLPRRQAARQVLEKGIQTGEFDPNLDIELAIDLLYGSLYYRLMLKHAPLDDSFGKDLPQLALRSFKHLT
jgi:AcrR family transcriptional regulator